MIKPNKYTHIGSSVIGLSAEIIKMLKLEPSQKYSILLDKIIYRRGEEAKENFILSLSFLFLLGKIVYYPEEDVVNLLNNKI